MHRLPCSIAPESPTDNRSLLPVGRGTISVALARIDRIADVADGVNQRRIADFFPQPANEHFDELRIVLMGMFPNALAEFRAGEDAARLPHQDFQQH